MTVVQPALAPPRIVSEDLPDGSRILRSEMPLEPYEASLGVLLRHWAEEAPDRVFLAERSGGAEGDWVELTWGEASRKANEVAQALLDRELGPQRPLMILSGNSIDQALLMLGGFLAGVRVVPVSPAYSLMSQDYGKVKHVAALVKPGLVYAADAGPFGGVLAAVDFGGAELVLSKGQGATSFGEMLATRPTAAVDEALSKVDPDSVAKVLFTSGSTAMPKGVISTHGMLCSNQQSLAQMPFTAETPPVLVDWLPWSHSFGGNHNFNLILKRGGTMYIDAGRPAPPLIPITVRNERSQLNPGLSRFGCGPLGDVQVLFDGDDEIVAVLHHTGDNCRLDRVGGVPATHHLGVVAQILHQCRCESDHHEHERQRSQNCDRLQSSERVLTTDEQHHRGDGTGGGAQKMTDGLDGSIVPRSDSDPITMEAASAPDTKKIATRTITRMLATKAMGY